MITNKKKKTAFKSEESLVPHLPITAAKHSSVTGVGLILSAWYNDFWTAGRLKWFAIYVEILLTDPGILLKDRFPNDFVKTDGTVPSAGKQILDFFWKLSVFQVNVFQGT